MASLSTAVARDASEGVVCGCAPRAVLAAVLGLPSEAELPQEPIRSAVKPPEKGAPHGLFVYTYTVDSKRAPDDKLYARSPWLREHMPRGFSVVVRKADDGRSCEVMCVMQVRLNPPPPIYPRQPHFLRPFFAFSFLYSSIARGSPLTPELLS